MYFTVSEFAKKIGVSATTLRVWDREGKLKPNHVTNGGRRMYSDEQLREYLNLNNRGSESIAQLDTMGTLNGIEFDNLSKADMKKIIDKYEADFNELMRDYQGMLGVLKYLYNRKE